MNCGQNADTPPACTSCSVCGEPTPIDESRRPGGAAVCETCQSPLARCTHISGPCADGTHAGKQCGALGRGTSSFGEPRCPRHDHSKATLQALSEVAHRAASSTTERDRLIGEAYKYGISMREIGRFAGMTHPNVRQILIRDGHHTSTK